MIGDTRVISIVAVAENGVIGTDQGSLPWDGYEEDKKHFMGTISGEPLVMGRRTAQRGDTFRKFTDSTHIVLTSNPDRDVDVEGMEFVGSIEEAKERIRSLNTDIIYNVGGGQVYKALLQDTDELIVSHLHDEHDGTVYFPEIDPDVWEVTSADERKEFTIKHYERRENQNS